MGRLELFLSSPLFLFTQTKKICSEDSSGRKAGGGAHALKNIFSRGKESKEGLERNHNLWADIMIIVFIGGDGSLRKFFVLRRHCPLYDHPCVRKHFTKTTYEERKKVFLNLPSNSFAVLRTRGSAKKLEPEDGAEVVPADMCKLLSKCEHVFDATSFALQRDHEIAHGMQSRPSEGR